MNNFSKNLKYYRLQKKLTQKEMADFLNITPNAYQKYEYGKREPLLNNLIKLADFFNVSLDDLVGRKFHKD
ncbi:helix-turn-helix domain-containing protein [Anaerofustis stercorihominis]|uniref:XRE family transcriptional regulator n=1 Tax=Anaerofustis stercorihominis TaxID=214853 RepID=A0A3E3DUH0_9FIRM|nr:helix-turn-helix transcriptional regulator [Anaerofustis stercorihominis]RGD72937.1 XRE family transcriptional regulator [Anaerofustis stercorihominis]